MFSSDRPSRQHRPRRPPRRLGRGGGRVGRRRVSGAAVASSTAEGVALAPIRVYCSVMIDSRTRDDTMMPASVIHSDPQVLGGTPVFLGTRVPLKNLIDYLGAGHSLEEFLDDFPTVSRAQALGEVRDMPDAPSAG